MATFLDLGFLQFFLPLFSFLFIVVVLYALMHKNNFLGPSDRVHWVAAISIGMIVLFSGSAVELINVITPWFVIMIVFLVLLFSIFMFFGTNEDQLMEKIGGHIVVVIVALLMLLAAISAVFGPVFNPYGVDEEGRTIQSETIRTLFHPRVLGAVFILLIAAFATKFIPEGK